MTVYLKREWGCLLAILDLKSATIFGVGLYFILEAYLLVYRTERDKAPPTPYLQITHMGTVELTNDQVLLSTCRMHVYKFPFDIQICNLTFKSVIHSGENATWLLVFFPSLSDC